MFALLGSPRGQRSGTAKSGTSAVHMCGSSDGESLMYYLMGYDEVSVTPRHRILGPFPEDSNVKYVQ